MRRQKRLKRIKNKKTRIRKITTFFYLLLILFIFLIVFIFIKVSSLNKFIFINDLNSNSEIVIVDPQKTKIVKILIPNETQIKSSRGFGIYKICNLWKLGDKENLKGKLVVESIRKNFLLPIYLWKSENKTNLTLWQRIKLLLLDIKASNYDVTEINLVDSKVLKQEKLIDGTMGYTINSKIPESISIYFEESNNFELISKTEIEDLTGNIKVTEDVSKILGIMGIKITSYSKGFDENLDCEVISKDKKTVELIGNVFNCKKIVDNNLLVDLKVRFGERFADRF